MSVAIFFTVKHFRTLWTLIGIISMHRSLMTGQIVFGRELFVTLWALHFANGQFDFVRTNVERQVNLAMNKFRLKIFLTDPIKETQKRHSLFAQNSTRKGFIYIFSYTFNKGLKTFQEKD
jgi:hypothetical protein